MSQYISPYRRGADQGFYFGLYLTALFFAMIGAEHFAALSLATIVLALGVPFIIYRMLRKTYREEHGRSQFSALWMQGIMIFLCGSMISGVAAFLYMRYIDPGFILRNAEKAIEVYRALNDAKASDVADMLQMIIDNKALPSAIQIVFQSIWGAVLSGSLLSMIVSLIVRSTHVPPAPPELKSETDSLER